MRDLDTKIADYHALRPSQFGVVKSITLTQAIDPASGEMQQQVSLVLATDEGYEGTMLHLELYGVRQLKLLQPTWSLVILPNLEIAKAPPMGHHEGPLIVFDAEQDQVISCSCRDFLAAKG